MGCRLPWDKSLHQKKGELGICNTKEQFWFVFINNPKIKLSRDKWTKKTEKKNKIPSTRQNQHKPPEKKIKPSKTAHWIEALVKILLLMLTQDGVMLTLVFVVNL